MVRSSVTRSLKTWERFARGLERLLPFLLGVVECRQKGADIGIGNLFAGRKAGHIAVQAEGLQHQFMVIGPEEGLEWVEELQHDLVDIDDHQRAVADSQAGKLLVFNRFQSTCPPYSSFCQA